MAPIISRGFSGRRRDDAPSDRVPPGQYVSTDYPVLSAGPTPHTPLDQWDFSIVGEVDEPRRWTWEEFRALPSEQVTVDIHCVTKWSGGSFPLDGPRGLTEPRCIGDGPVAHARLAPPPPSRTCTDARWLGGRRWEGARAHEDRQQGRPRFSW
jgi:DMSO/TMAO reductase YedYZ molybdopterin-dependent catalytic subunit